MFLVSPAGADPLDEVPPAPPWGLDAAPQENGVLLTWNAPAANGSADVEGYVVYRSHNGSTFDTVAVVEMEGYFDLFDGGDELVMYAVSAVSDAGESFPTMTTSSDYPRCPVIAHGSPIFQINPTCVIPPPVCCIPWPGGPDHSFLFEYMHHPLMQQVPCPSEVRVQGIRC